MGLAQALLARCAETNRTTLSLRLLSDPSVSYQARLAAAQASFERNSETHVEPQSLATGGPLRDAIRRGLVDFGFERGPFRSATLAHPAVMKGTYRSLLFQRDRLTFFTQTNAGVHVSLTHPADFDRHAVTLFWTDDLPTRTSSLAELLAVCDARARVVPRQVQDWSDVAFADISDTVGACPASVFDRMADAMGHRIARQLPEGLSVSCDIVLTYDVNRIDERAVRFFLLLQEEQGGCAEAASGNAAGTADSTNGRLVA